MWNKTLNYHELIDYIKEKLNYDFYKIKNIKNENNWNLKVSNFFSSSEEQ